MIEIKNTEVFGWGAAIRGMRNPMNSWDRSDSTALRDQLPLIGENDMGLMKSLSKSGSDHRKFMRMIHVQCDIVAPLYWWKEEDQYRICQVTNGCSTMHRLMSRPFEMGDFSFDKLPGYKSDVNQFRPDIDESNEKWISYEGLYDVSNMGRIMRNGRILSGSLHKDGYIFVTLRGKQQPLHRVIAKAFIGDICGLEVNHIDGNEQNNRVDNLELCTRSENQQHAVDNHLQPVNVNTYKGKFTAEQREQIKRDWDNGKHSRRELAKMYGVSHTCISAIINDKYKYAERVNLYEEIARPIVDALNELRDSWMTCEDNVEKKRIWYSMIQLLPSSYNQRRTIDLNYEVLRNMYHARKNHKLDEWREFCGWIESLPYSELITGGEDNA